MKVRELLKKIDTNAIWKEVVKNNLEYFIEITGESEPFPEGPPEGFIKALNEMRTIEPLPSQDGNLWRVVIIKYLDEYCHREDEERYDVDLIKNNEDMRYACDFINWAEFVGYEVCETSIKWYGEVACAAEIYWEITFWGGTNDDVIAKSASLEKMSNKSRARSKAGKLFKAYEKMIRKIKGVPRKWVDERTEEEIMAQEKKSEEYDKINRELYLRFLDEEIGAENVVEAEYDW